MVDAECEAKVDPTAIILFGRSSLRLCLGMLQHVGRRVWLLCRRFLARRRISIGVLLLRWRGTCDVNPIFCFCSGDSDWRWSCVPHEETALAALMQRNGLVYWRARSRGYEYVPKAASRRQADMLGRTRETRGRTQWPGRPEKVVTIIWIITPLLSDVINIKARW
jgi:hypothetical protein